jgi:hypothetical protein
MQTLRFFDNTGGMNLRASDVGLDNGNAEDIVNLHIAARGTWSNSNTGYIHLNTTPLVGPINGLYDYITLTGQSHLMAMAGNTLYTFEPNQGLATAISAGLAADRLVCFTTFQGLLVLCNGTDAPRKWDGFGAVENLAGWPAVIPGLTPGKPSISEIFANRLIFSGDDNHPSMIYISELENPENFTPDTGSDSAGAIQVSPGDGQRVTALKTLFLPMTNQEVLVIFKERSTYILTGSDADTFALQKISDEFGAVSHRCVLLIGNELMFLSKEGVTALSTATIQGNLTTGFLSDRIRPQIENLNRFKLHEAFALHLRHRQEVWWFVPGGSATRNQTVLVYNYGINRAWSRRTGISAASGIVMNGNVYTGNHEGIIQQQLKGNNYHGQPIPWTYRTGFHDLAAPRIRKRLKDIELFLRQISNVDVTVNMYWDFRRGSGFKQSRTLTVVPDAASSIFGAARFGQDYYHFAGSSIFKFIPAGSGRYFQLELTGSAVNRPVEIEGWTATAIYGGYC